MGALSTARTGSIHSAGAFAALRGRALSIDSFTVLIEQPPAAGPMFVLGHKIKDAGNLKMTTDFRSVSGTMLSGWGGFADTRALLKGNFPALPLFG